ncbi:MAG: hypothetical protein IJL87_03940 [Clostridia bacterium]|nr:hypothetical protein [Clostridia bacterium]
MSFFEKIKDIAKREGSEYVLVSAIILAAAIIISILFSTGGKKSVKPAEGDFDPTESYTIDEVILPTVESTAPAESAAPADSQSPAESGAPASSEVDFNQLLPDLPVGEEDKKVDLEITEENFVPQIYSIATGYDANGYIYQTFKITGVSGTNVYNGVTYHDVYRMALLDSSPEGRTERVGLEYIYDGEYPADGTWVTVTGVLRAYEENDVTYLTLDAISVEPAEEESFYVLP